MRTRDPIGGDSDIGRKVAELLGWMGVDKQIIERVSAVGKVQPSWAEKADKHASAWWEQVMKSFRKGGLESLGEGPDAKRIRQSVRH